MEPTLAAMLLARLTEACGDIEEVRGMLGEQGGIWATHIPRCNAALEQLTQIQAALARLRVSTS